MSKKSSACKLATYNDLNVITLAPFKDNHAISRCPKIPSLSHANQLKGILTYKQSLNEEENVVNNKLLEM